MLCFERTWSVYSISFEVISAVESSMLCTSSGVMINMAVDACAVNWLIGTGKTVLWSNISHVYGMLIYICRYDSLISLLHKNIHLCNIVNIEHIL